MKVLIFPSWYPTLDNPLSGTFVKEQSNLLIPDHDLKVLYPRYIGKKDFIYNSLKRNKNIFEQYQIIKPPDGIEIFLFQANGLSERFEFNYIIRQCEKGLEKLISRNWKPDLIHAHVTVWAGTYAVSLGKKYNIPVIITEHQNPFLLNEFSKRQVDRITETIENADLIASVSNHQSRSILSHNIKCFPVVVGNLVDDDLFTIKPKKTNLFTILTVGGSAFYKDLDTFLKALAIVKRNGKSNFRAQIIGIRDSHTSFKDFIIKNNIEENCEFLTGVARELMPNCYADCDVMISTSIAETFGVSIGEAIASGKPVICTRNGGAEDFVNESNGYLVDVQDYEAIANRIMYLMENGFHSTPQEIRNSITSKFGRKAFKARINKIYHQVVSDYKKNN